MLFVIFNFIYFLFFAKKISFEISLLQFRDNNVFFLINRFSIKSFLLFEKKMNWMFRQSIILKICLNINIFLDTNVTSLVSQQKIQCRLFRVQFIWNHWILKTQSEFSNVLHFDWSIIIFKKKQNKIHSFYSKLWSYTILALIICRYSIDNENKKLNFDIENDRARREAKNWINLSLRRHKFEF